MVNETKQDGYQEMTQKLQESIDMQKQQLNVLKSQEQEAKNTKNAINKQTEQQKNHHDENKADSRKNNRILWAREINAALQQ